MGRVFGPRPDRRRPARKTWSRQGNGRHGSWDLSPTESSGRSSRSPRGDASEGGERDASRGTRGGTAFIIRQRHPIARQAATNPCPETRVGKGRVPCKQRFTSPPEAGVSETKSDYVGRANRSRFAGADRRVCRAGAGKQLDSIHSGGAIPPLQSVRPGEAVHSTSDDRPNRASGSQHERIAKCSSRAKVGPGFEDLVGAAG